MFRHPSRQPLWREEFSVFKADERYVNRRQMTKFLTLTSLGMFAGNVWILAKSLFSKDSPAFPSTPVARVGEVPVGGVKLFPYPTPKDQCILVRTSETEYVAYSQKCTHLSCPVIYRAADQQLYCPCHEGRFAVEDGRALAGPPKRPLPRIMLTRRGEEIWATAVEV